MNLPNDNSFASWLTEHCTGECGSCGLHQPHKEVTCRGTEKMQEIEKWEES